MSGGVEQTNVKVMVRVRPFNSREIGLTEGGIEKLRSIIVMEGSTVRLLEHEKNYVEREAFEFDECFWSLPESQGQLSTKPFTTNEDVFEASGKPAVKNALAGYHNTIFAYGQTGSGKTHTMLGCASDEGIAPRLVRYLFEQINTSKNDLVGERIQFTVELSFLEIYNEKVKDLLAIAEKGKGRSNQGESGYAECRVRNHPEKGTFVEGLTRTSIDEEAQCLTAIKDGMEHRAITSTLMNDTSSRSHAIFQIALTQKMPLKGTSRLSVINLVDLAGSERISMSGVAGQALKEAMSINLSLSTLRRVIDILIDNSKLKKGQRPSVPPFRESLLTWVLSDSLGGNSKTVMVAAISPFSGNSEDTMGTLRYALKAKAIVCNARVNEEKTQAVVNAMRLEMEELRKQLVAKANADQEEKDRIDTEIKETEENFEKMQLEAKRLEDLKVEYEQELIDKKSALTDAQTEIANFENVEEEKERKEAELNQARLMRTEADQLLKQTEEDRGRREDELELLKSRKKMLQEHHDKAAEEEAKAKLAAEQSRLRQFARTFSNAFKLTTKKSGLHNLVEEHTILKETIMELETAVHQKQKTLSQLVSEKGMLQRKMGLSQKRASEIYEEVHAVKAQRAVRVAEVRELRDAAEEELLAVQQELEARETELRKLRQVNSVAQAETERDMEISQLDIRTSQEKLKKQLEKNAKLEAECSSAEVELTQLEEDHKVAVAKLAALRAENEKNSMIVEEFKKRNAEITEKRVAITKTSTDTRADSNELNETLSSLLKDVQELREVHSELRTFVSNKFFPIAATTAPAPGSTVHVGSNIHSVNTRQIDWYQGPESRSESQTGILVQSKSIKPNSRGDTTGRNVHLDMTNTWGPGKSAGGNDGGMSARNRPSYKDTEAHKSMPVMGKRVSRADCGAGKSHRATSFVEPNTARKK